MGITLYKQEGATRIHIEATVTVEGDLQVAGHDIGEAPKQWWGHDDYEYIVTVRRQHKEHLFATLKSTLFSNEASVESQLHNLAKQKNIPIERLKQDEDFLLLAMIAAQFGHDASAVSRFRDFVQEKDIPHEWFTWP